MKVIFIGGRDIQKLGGIENYMLNLATNLVVKGYDAVVFCESDRNEIEYINGFKVIYQKSIGGRFLCKILLSYKATIRALLQEKDAVVFHYNAWPPSLASWLAVLCGKKVVLQGHGLEWKRTKYTPFQRKIMKMMEGITARLHRNILMVSQEQTDFFRTEYNKKCITIPTAVNLPGENSGKDKKILLKFNIKSNNYFLFLGRLVQDKNPDVLIKAFIRAGITDKLLVIAGDNPSNIAYVNSLHSLAKANSNIIFTGAVYGEDKEALLKECLAFCIPSTLEGLPITLLEAMSYKRICIASDIPACHEALGESGVWVRPEDVNDLSEKLLYVIENAESLEKEGSINYTRICEKFTWAKVVEQYVHYVLK